MNKVKIGLVGCGAIGLEISRAIEARLSQKSTLAAVCDIDRLRVQSFLEKLKTRPRVCSLKELISEVDFVVECASGAVSGQVAELALAAGKDVLVMSVGGLLSKDISNLAGRSKSRLYIPSGALAGLDALKAASCAKIDKIMLTTKKSPQGLDGAPHLVENNIDISSLKQEKVVFEGTAVEAVKGFPKNINVAATLSLAAAAGVFLRIRIVAVPGLKVNVHEVEAEGSFGKFYTRTENLPSPDNPKTSFLAALSAIATLEGALDNIRIGT